MPLLELSAAAAAGACPPRAHNSSSCVFPEPAAACTCSWSLRRQWQPAPTPDTQRQRWLTPAPGAHIGGVVLPESARARGKKLRWRPHPSRHVLQQWHIASPAGPGAPLVMATPHSSPFRQPTPVLSPGLSSEACASAPSPHPPQRTRVSGWAVQGGGISRLCRSLSILPSVNWLLDSPPRFHSSPSVQADLPACEGTSRVWAPFLFHSSLPGVQAPSQFLSLSFFFFSFVLPSCVEVSLPFLKPEAFCQVSVDVL